MHADRPQQAASPQPPAHVERVQGTPDPTRAQADATPPGTAHHDAASAPAPAGAVGELRLRVPRTYIVSDVPLPLVYH